ncbi:MAG: ABC transporter ATP-binding protein [Candidatus Scatovivens sp.]
MIEVKNVTKKYGNFYAVRNISFSIEDGEIIGFLGRNGAGKTTTMNMLTGFIEPTEGSIEIDGFDIEKKPKNVKSLIGYMPEGVPLYTDLTVKEFISYMADLKTISKSQKKEAVNKAIEDTGLKQVENKLTRNLSRGYKQRVSLAGALVGNPKILILDEPTVGLDPKQVVEIRELIKSLRKDHTVILSSHILPEVAQICEKVIIIDKGEIVAIDTPENLETSTEEKQEIIVTIEDFEDKFEKIGKEIPNINQINLISDNNDNSKTYKIEFVKNEDIDIRKELFGSCSKNNITILEMKKEEKSLEDAFIKIIDKRPDLTASQIEEIELKKELEEMKKEEEEKKQKKQEKKEKKKENKESKKQKKDKKEKEENNNDSNN